ncbi:MAG: gluconokinase [Thermoproteota archaeon]
MQHFISVDIGTSSIKGCLYNEKLLPIRNYNLEVPSITNSLAHEHDPKLIFKSFLEVIKYLAKGYHDKISAISFDTYNHSLILLDSEEHHLTNVITGMDLRAGKYMHTWLNQVDAFKVYQETGCPPLFIYLPARILWLRKEKPELLSKSRKLLSVKDYIMMQIFGTPYLDYGTASGNGVLDLRLLKYSENVLSSLGISEGELGVLVEGKTVLGKIPRKFLDQANISSNDVVLVPSTFDGAAQSFGLGSFFPKGAVNLGTTAVVRTICEEARVDADKQMRFFCYYAAGGKFAVGGSSNNGGSLLSWLKDTIFDLEKTVSTYSGLDVYKLISLQASRAPPGSEGLLFLPYIHGERFPFRSPGSAGIIFGLKPNHTKSHIARAAMEGVGFTLKSMCEALSENSLSLKELLIAGGGSESDVWVQTIADVLGLQTSRTSNAENLSCLGNVLLTYSSLFSEPLEKINYKINIRNTYYPNYENFIQYKKSFCTFKALFSTLRPFFEERV